MKRILAVILSISFLILFTGCSFLIQDEPKPIHELLSDNKDKYSLLIISDEDHTKWTELLYEHTILNVKPIRQHDSLEETNKQYPFLKLEKSPAFILFDQKEVVHKTYDENDLIDFLENN